MSSSALISPRLLSFSQLPLALREMEEPPLHAYLWGELPPGPYVGIVGRRAPSPEGLAAAERLAFELASEGVTILSGGALGIDTAAHRGALLAGGKTVVLAPVWLDHAYPSENRELFMEILERGGAYFSLAERSGQPLRPAFFLRNEALAAWSQALVLGECGYRSGARNTASRGEKLGRRLFVLPSPYGSAGVGNNEWLSHGGRALTRARPLLEYLEQLGRFDNPRWWASLERRRSAQEREPQKLERSKDRAARLAGEGELASREVRSPSGEEGQIAQAVARGANTVDRVCEETGLAVRIVQHHILSLILKGVLDEDERGLLRYHPGPHVHPPSHHRRRRPRRN